MLPVNNYRKFASCSRISALFSSGSAAASIFLHFPFSDLLIELQKAAGKAAPLICPSSHWRNEDLSVGSLWSIVNMVSL